MGRTKTLLKEKSCSTCEFNSICSLDHRNLAIATICRFYKTGEFAPSPEPKRKKHARRIRGERIPIITDGTAKARITTDLKKMVTYLLNQDLDENEKLAVEATQNSIEKGGFNQGQKTQLIDIRSRY